MSINDLYAAALGQESYARTQNQQVIQEMGDRQGRSVAASRAGANPMFIEALNRAAGQAIRPVDVNSNPAIETAAAGQLSRASSSAMLEEMQRIMDERSPSGLDKFAGYALPIAGMALGGAGMLGMEGGLAGASAGGSFGGLLSGMMRGY
jgi:hypothetical protein